MDEIIKLQVPQILAAYIFIVIILVIVKKRGIPRDKEIFIASIRMTLQLILTGYILTYVFGHENPFVSILIVCIMETFAINNIFKRIKHHIDKPLKKVIISAMLIGTVSCLIFFIFIIIRVNPWYEPRYFIPIGGMIIGNSMTGISLGINRLIDGMKTQRESIESALMLGAIPKDACKKIIDDTFDAALMPTINSMVGMGIVFLPGMMTGQILAGALPLTAISYQIAIMLGILGSVSITVFIAVQRGYKTFFNESIQLNLVD